jgi:3-deoxy-D-manno-octulosonate 8-phosphate phosphatase (KDO 8-P phosphatase)
MQDILQRAARIRLLILDVDGVLTDGRLYLSSDGVESKAFHTRDGHGIKLLREGGVNVAVISGRRSRAVELRMTELGVEHLYQGIDNKLTALDELVARLDLELDEVAHVGDDVIDLPVMRKVGLAIAVQDASEFVKRHAHWQTANAGGRGAVRDACELILEAQGSLEVLLDRYL